MWTLGGESFLFDDFAMIEGIFSTQGHPTSLLGF